MKYTTNDIIAIRIKIIIGFITIVIPITMKIIDIKISIGILSFYSDIIKTCILKKALNIFQQDNQIL